MELKAKLLGDFEMTINGKQVVLEGNKPTKANLMFQYMLYQRDKGAMKNQLISMFFDSEDIVNPENNLKVNMHRLRKLLKDAVDEEIEIIQVEKSNYHINKDINIEIDLETFNDLYNSALAEPLSLKKSEYLAKAVNVYGGELLPYLNTIPGVAYANMESKERYLDALMTLVEIKNTDYLKNLELLNRAIHIYPYDDELYVVKMRILIESSNYKEAAVFYTDTTSFFLENLGIESLPNLKNEYQKLSQSAANHFSDIYEVRDEIQEIEPRYAYYCNYLSFIDNYHIINRLMKRMGRSVFMLLCTINLPKGNENLEAESQYLREAITNTLRSGDIFTRYNANQYVVLLCNIQQENVSTVTDRLKLYLRKNTKSNVSCIQFSAVSTLEVK